MDLPVSTGQLYLEIRDDAGLSRLSLNIMITSSAAQISVDLPSDLTPGKYWVKVLGSSEDFSWIGHGSTPFQVSGKSIHHVEVQPGFPTSSDSILLLDKSSSQMGPIFITFVIFEPFL